MLGVGVINHNIREGNLKYKIKQTISILDFKSIMYFRRCGTKKNYNNIEVLVSIYAEL